MRLWLPEKASARLSIKGLLGADPISLRDIRTDLPREGGDLMFRDQLGNCVLRHDKMREKARREGDTWRSCICDSVH